MERKGGIKRKIIYHQQGHSYDLGTHQLNKPTKGEAICGAYQLNCYISNKCPEKPLTRGRKSAARLFLKAGKTKIGFKRIKDREKTPDTWGINLGRSWGIKIALLVTSKKENAY